MLSRWNGFGFVIGKGKWKEIRDNNKTLLESGEIKKMTDSKSIKSNERKNGPWAIDINDFLYCRPSPSTGSHKKHSCLNIAFFPPNWNWQAMSMEVSQAWEMAINIQAVFYRQNGVSPLLHLTLALMKAIRFIKLFSRKMRAAKWKIPTIFLRWILY